MGMACKGRGCQQSSQSCTFPSHCQKFKVLPAPMANRAAPIPVSISLGHASANAVKATVRGGAGPLVAPRV